MRVHLQQEEVVRAYLGWEQELHAWFQGHERPQDRALLIAAATVAMEAPEGYVYEAAAALAKGLNIEPHGGGLAWWPKTGLGEMLDAEHANSRVTFRRAGYAEAALRHVFHDFPLARSELFDWLAELPTGAAEGHELAHTVAGSFADLAAEHGEAGRVTAAAQRWAAASDRGLPDLAFIVLSRTCLDPLVGGRVRTALYDWSTKVTTTQALKVTIARVCQVIALAYPPVALTRLKHLATNGNLNVAREVVSAATAIAAAGNRQVVLRAGLDWCAEGNSKSLSHNGRRRRRRAGAMLLLEFLGQQAESGPPQMLPVSSKTAFTCVPYWRAALIASAVGGQGSVAERAICRWLDAALRNPRLLPGVVAVFVAAAGGNEGSVRLMIHSASKWAAATPADMTRRAIMDQIIIPLTSSWRRRLHLVLQSKLAGSPM
jgi:hypothetical protein